MYRSPKNIKTKAGFTLIELVVVISLIAILTVISSLSFSFNPASAAKTYASRLITDMYTLKKESLLISSFPPGVFTIYNNDLGYSMSGSDTAHIRMVQQTPVSGSSQQERVFTYKLQQPGTNGFVDYPYNPDTDPLRIQYRNPAGTIITPALQNSGSTLTIDIPQPTLTRTMTFYLQDPQKIQEKTLETTYTFLDSSNYNTDEDDNIALGLRDVNQQPIEGIHISFDSLGHIVMTDVINTAKSYDKVEIQFILKETGTVLTTLQLPNDLAKNP